MLKCWTSVEDPLLVDSHSSVDVDISRVHGKVPAGVSPNVLPLWWGASLSLSVRV